MLLLKKGGLYKSVRFKDHRYVGDPINAVKIFNEKGVDELIVLDIDATVQGKGPNFEAIAEIAGEAFIPLAYGGGISTVEQIKKLFFLGIEKVVLNTQAFENPKLITEAASLVGSQSVVVSIDYKKSFLGGYQVHTDGGKKNRKINPVEFAKQMESAGAGEIVLNAIERDGTYMGYDVEMVKKVADAVNIPVVACGGAGEVEDFNKAMKSGASAVAAGSMFVFQRPHQAVLISYPSEEILKRDLFSKLSQ